MISPKIPTNHPRNSFIPYLDERDSLGKLRPLPNTHSPRRTTRGNSEQLRKQRRQKEVGKYRFWESWVRIKREDTKGSKGIHAGERLSVLNKLVWYKDKEKREKIEKLQKRIEEEKMNKNSKNTLNPRSISQKVMDDRSYWKSRDITEISFVQSNKNLSVEKAVNKTGKKFVPLFNPKIRLPPAFSIFFF